jgi:hypothetical protein
MLSWGMSNCAIPGCPNEAVAHGLCAKHYMRQRRRGDPNAEFKPGRQPKPKPADPELDALKRDNAALREQIAALARERDEARAKGGAAMLLDHLAAIGKERDKLAREIDAFKAKLAVAPDDRVTKLERELKGARTRINNLRAEAALGWAASKANPAVISKPDHVKLIKVFHPDGEARVSKAREAQLTEAFQIFKALKLTITDKP